MNNNKFLFFDTETTGVSRDSYLVQVAWFLTYADGEIISQNEFIIKPDGYEIPYRVSLIHGITTSKAHEAGKALDLVLEAFTEDADKAEHIVGHNISFDLAIMQTAYNNASMEFPLNGKTKFDTMTASTQWCQLTKASGEAGYKRPKLSELHYKLFGEYFDNAHSACADTEATMKSFFELVEIGVINISSNSKDNDKSSKKIDLYKKSCELGSAQHCAKLGKIYSKNEEKDVSIKYFEKACALGDGNSCLQLGGRYQTGIDKYKDQNKANEFFLMSCNLNYGAGCSYLGRAYEDGKGDIKQNHSKAIKYFEKACDLGCSWGCGLLGDAYKKGEIVEQDYLRAMKYYEKGCEFLDINKGAQIDSICFDVAEMHKKGKNIKQNFSKAIKYYEKGCDLGDLSCCLELGHIYRDEESLYKSDFKAFNAYKKGCNLYEYDFKWRGISRRAAWCCNNLGVMYAQGKGTNKDVYKSIACFDKACDSDYSSGFYNLAQVYHGFVENSNKKVYDFECDDSESLILTRVNVKDESVKKALKLYKKSCELGNSRACACYKKLAMNV